MSMLNVVIIEDEAHGQETLKNLLKDYCENIEIAGIAGSVKEGIKAIEAIKPDLIFLDIELHTGTGFEILENVNRYDFEVIFTTAYENYAIKAIKFSAIDYLLKPIDITELREAVDKVRKRREQSLDNHKLLNFLKNLQGQNDSQKIITLATSEGMEFIPVADIIKLEANGSYTTFYLKQGRSLLVSKNLKEYENLLSEHGFFRVHHSCMINLNQVERYVKSEGGSIILKDGSQADISQKKKEKFLELMSQRNV
jgi:two-component system, LytTR family, response regulator